MINLRARYGYILIRAPPAGHVDPWPQKTHVTCTATAKGLERTVYSLYSVIMATGLFVTSPYRNVQLVNEAFYYYQQRQTLSLLLRKEGNYFWSECKWWNARQKSRCATPLWEIKSVLSDKNALFGEWENVAGELFYFDLNQLLFAFF